MAASNFAALGVPADVVDILKRNAIKKPLPMQEASLPDAIAGHDVTCCAPAGSGSTLAFGLALVTRTERAKPNRPTSLVLVPTREAAGRVAGALHLVAAVRGLRVATVFGDTGYDKQRAALRHGVEILVACPGRLEELLDQRDLSLENVRAVVVAGVDRLAAIGLLPAVEALLKATHKDSQTLVYSTSTLEGDVDEFIRTHQKDPKRYDAPSSNKWTSAMALPAPDAETSNGLVSSETVVDYVGPQDRTSTRRARRRHVRSR